MAVRYEVIWAVVVDGRRVCGYFDRQLAILDARMHGGKAQRCLVECPVDCYGFAILPDWYYGGGLAHPVQIGPAAASTAEG